MVRSVGEIQYSLSSIGNAPTRGDVAGVRRAERIAQQEVGVEGAINVKRCPVCRATALVIYKDTEIQDFDEEQLSIMYGRSSTLAADFHQS
jgi:hypothetical protein